MLDLKAKLASAGLVSQDDIDRVEKQRTRGKARKDKQAKARSAGDDIARVVASLRDKPKGEAYDAIRKWVDRVRLDASGGTPSANATTFHFAEHTGTVGRLYLEPAVADQLRAAKAGIVAYMSNSGLAHAVVPADDARGIAELFPAWLRFLEGDDRAGAIAKDES
jgi:hypothetical protein